MGGYGLYVWGSFGVTALAFAVESWSLRARHHALRRELGASNSPVAENS